uniref:Uncharacterized protein n=1 Tax=Favella ehrenbergii TaxID=182087 RepID=A0A7S3HVX7_9SPIT|mmetsp:Transcript_31882/g.37525  ORF Transcript_31882/g.37525 Transcript_31882/m.37525 type:complete len:312 (+) Transcript_31882:1-936(+)
MLLASTHALSRVRAPLVRTGIAARPLVSNSSAHFSTEKKPSSEPVEYTVNEEELFGEKKMQEAQKSIGEKLKAIKKRQQEEEAAGESYIHDPNKFSFVRTSRLKDVHSGTYCYSGNRLSFEKRTPQDSVSAHVIYKTNSAVYQTAEIVDMMCSGLVVYCGYKVCRNSYLMATQAGLLMSYAPFTALWAFAGFMQYHYLQGAYLQQVYLVDEIELLDNLKQLRIRTVFFNMRANLFAMARLQFVDQEAVKREYIVDIKDCQFSDKDKPDSTILRIEVGELKLFAHRNRTIYVNSDLLRAVFTPEVHRIETLR